MRKEHHFRTGRRGPIVPPATGTTRITIRRDDDILEWFREHHMDPSSFLLGALIVSAKGLGIGAIGFGIAWWRARNRIRELEAQGHLDPEPLHDRMDRLEGSLDSVAAALERLAAGQRELQRQLPPLRPGSEATRPPNTEGGEF